MIYPRYLTKLVLFSYNLQNYLTGIFRQKLGTLGIIKRPCKMPPT